MGKLIDLVGKKFGKLTVLSITDERNADNRVIWKCQCDCGNIKNVSSNLLKSGDTKSCGCSFYKDLVGAVNEMRMDLSVDRFKELCKLITERN